MGGLTLYPIHYRAAFASSLIPPPLPHRLLCRKPTLAGRQRGYFVHLLDRPGVRSCLSAGGAPSATGEFGAPVPDHLPFWFKPDSILGLSLVTAFTGTSPGLTWPGLLAPNRRDAGSRRVGSRVHGRSEDRGYVVPQASDVAVAGDARWGSRPMAEHRVISEDLLGVTHYRSGRCYESQPNCQGASSARSERPEPSTSVYGMVGPVIRSGAISARLRPPNPCIHGGLRPPRHSVPAARLRSGPASRRAGCAGRKELGGPIRRGSSRPAQPDQRDPHRQEKQRAGASDVPLAPKALSDKMYT